MHQMKHIKPFMESVGWPRVYTFNQMRSMHHRQVMDEITPGEADVVAKAIAAAGLQGAMEEYEFRDFVQIVCPVNKKHLISDGKITLEGVGPTSVPFHNLYFTKYDRTDFLSIFKTTDDWWWVETDDSCHLCDGIKQVVDLIRSLKSDKQ